MSILSLKNGHVYIYIYIYIYIHGRNHHILWGGRVPPQCWKNTNLSPPIIGLLYCNMWHMICPPFMNPGCSLVDLLLFPIYFQFRKNKGNKTVWKQNFPGVYGLKWCDCKSLLLFILRYDFCYKVLVIKRAPPARLGDVKSVCKYVKKWCLSHNSTFVHGVIYLQWQKCTVHSEVFTSA